MTTFNAIQTIIATWTPARWLRRVGMRVRLVRPVNLVIVMAGVVLGGLLSGGLSALEGGGGLLLGQAALSAALIAAGASSLNDALDLETDRVTRPDRPLPSGLVSAGTARLVWGLGTGAGLLLAFRLSLLHVAMALAMVGLMVFYNVYLKRTPLLGNIVVALAISLTLVYGGLVVGVPGPALVGAGFALLTTMAHELVKDLEAMEGDAAVGARTLPLVYGAGVALRVTCVVLFLTLFLTPLPFLLFAYRGLFLLMMLATDALLLYTLWVLLEPEAEASAGQASRLLKAVIAAGMLALALGALVQVGD